MLKFQRDILKEFEPVGRRAKVVLFGSIARGDYRLDSDIDLAIILDGKADKALSRLSSSIADKVLVKYGKLVSLKFVSEKDLNEGSNSFMREVRMGRLIYHGHGKG